MNGLRPSRAWWLPLLVAASLWTRDGDAFCRATTCDPAKPGSRCEIGAEQCITSGEQLYWASGCVTFSVQADGAPSQNIDYEAAEQAVQQAFATWREARCDDGSPALDVRVAGPVTCNVSEYNRDKGNANIVMFREEDWPYEGSQDALGLTRLRFNADTGELWDADIEVNAVAGELGTGDAPSGADLLSLLTHEAGHALGLAHTLVEGATMSAGYESGTDFRSLEHDDVAGICAIYPPGRSTSSQSCDARNGFADLCGAEQAAPVEPPADEGEPDSSATDVGDCSFAARPATSQLSGCLLLGVAIGLPLMRRRRARSQR